jgi:hypothetical protein
LHTNKKKVNRETASFEETFTCYQLFGANKRVNRLHILHPLFQQLARFQRRFIDEQKRALRDAGGSKQKFTRAVIFLGTYQSLLTQS